MITAASEADIQRQILQWQRALERNGLKVNTKKTETLMTSKDGGEECHMVDAHGEPIKQVDQFCYLGSIVEEQGGCSEEIRNRIKRAWMKRRETSGIVCDRGWQ